MLTLVVTIWLASWGQISASTIVSRRIDEVIGGSIYGSPSPHDCNFPALIRHGAQPNLRSLFGSS